MSSRRLQGVFRVTLFASKTSWRRLQDVSKTYLQCVFLKRLQDVFQDVFKTFLQNILQLCLQDVLKDKTMLHWRLLEDVFKTSSVRLHQGECLLGCLTMCISKVTFSFPDTMYEHAKNQLYLFIHSWDTANYRVLWPKTTHPYLTMPTQQLLK